MNSQPTLMNTRMLMDATRDEALNIKKLCGGKQTVDMSDISQLHLNLKNILKIDILHDFTSLVKLDLFHNLIEKIEGLDSLYNLTWLNLSYNKITKIEGLDGLKKLEVLNLSNNNISRLENMDALQNLSHFLVANNLIKDLDNVLYLTRMKKLYELYMVGNPVSDGEEYTLFSVAFLPKLRYLDDTLINIEIREEASMKYQQQLHELAKRKNQKQQRTEAENAFVEDIDGSSLFNSLFKDNPEVLRPHCLPEVAPLLQTLEVQMKELCLHLFEVGLAEHRCRQTELRSFYSGQNEVETFYKQKTSQILAEFDEQRTQMAAESKNLEDINQSEVKIRSFSDAVVPQLHNSLLKVAFELLGNREENIKTFDDAISAMVDDFVRTSEKTFAQLRDLEELYHQNVNKIVIETLEKVANHNEEGAIPEDVMRLFADQDSVKEALATSHKARQLKMDNRENQLVRRVRAWKSAVIAEIKENELRQNHMHMSDINRYVQYQEATGGHFRVSI
ncbi:dynein regulatory complex subunit 3 [Nothobranchius furzeri]|uniref:Dynein regulatory complex subunit 3 n=1 Tax=Nothobranchius furzeri TaxID=105023 RepID=A0A1A8AL66_NOTFU